MPDHLDIIRGDTPTIRLGPIRRNGANVNLTGATTLALTVKQLIADAGHVFQKAGTLKTVETTNDSVEFVLASADTDGLTPGDTLVYDIQIVEANGTKTTFPKGGPGTLLIVADVNRG
ncbi:MAG: hypothetical protein ACRDY6_13700 [Acidimicrobiia bacterium]